MILNLLSVRIPSYLRNLILEDLVVILTSMDDLDTSSHHAKDVGPYREHRLWVIGLNWGSYYDPTRLGGGLGPSYLRRFIGSSSNTSSTSNIEKVLRSSRINGWEHLLLVTWWYWISFQLGNILTWGTYLPILGENSKHRMTSEMIINCLVNEGGLENLGDLVLFKCNCMYRG